MLRGLGVAVALPWLEAMGGGCAWADDVPKSKAAPNRMAFIYVPNGKNMADWTPATDGPNFKLGAILEPLAEVRDDFMIITGLAADKARAHGDGGGDHARAMAAFLTGSQPRKTDGTDIRAGISVDQVAASRVGDQVHLSSLEIGCEPSQMAGNCDSGYSCVYNSTMSWKSATQPQPKETNPKLVFERLFSSGDDTLRAKAVARNKSVLDLVREDAKDLNLRLGASDKRKLDEYSTSIRDIEIRMERAAKLPPVKAPDGFEKPTGVPETYEQHIRIMSDLLVLAFQADVTRVSTFVFANEGSNKPYPFINVAEGHHDLSHHGKDATKMSKIREINIFHTKQLAYLLKKMKSIKEGDGTLLDHCMIAYGSGNSDGDRHNHDDLPLLLAGKGCGTIKTARHLKLQRETPLNNLWLSLLDRMNMDVKQLGDSTGALSGLS
jgi:hypothetical protein